MGQSRCVVLTHLSRAGKAQAAAGSRGHHGLTSCHPNTLQLSVGAVQVGSQRRRALTSCEQRLPPCSGGLSIPGTTGCLGCGRPVFSSAGHCLPQTDGHVHDKCRGFEHIAAFHTAALTERSGKHRFPQLVILTPMPDFY